MTKESYPVESEASSETVKCECGKDELLKYATMDEDGNWSCHECLKDHLLSVFSSLAEYLGKEKERLKNLLEEKKTGLPHHILNAKVEMINEILFFIVSQES